MGIEVLAMECPVSRDGFEVSSSGCVLVVATRRAVVLMRFGLRWFVTGLFALATTFLGSNAIFESDGAGGGTGSRMAGAGVGTGSTVTRAGVGAGAGTRLGAGGLPGTMWGASWGTNCWGASAGSACWASSLGSGSGARRSTSNGVPLRGGGVSDLATLKGGSLGASNGLGTGTRPVMSSDRSFRVRGLRGEPGVGGLRRAASMSWMPARIRSLEEPRGTVTSVGSQDRESHVRREQVSSVQPHGGVAPV
jgi:hypothetical protein